MPKSPTLAFINKFRGWNRNLETYWKKGGIAKGSGGITNQPSFD
jgi:hypothetical protein